MSNPFPQFGSGRTAFAGLVVAVFVLLILDAGLFYILKKTNAVEKDAQARAAALGDRLQDLENRFSAFKQAPPAVPPLSVADRCAMLSLVEKSIPTITDRILVRRKADNAGFEFTFTLTNTSGIALDCTTPLVEMTRNDYPPTQTNPNLVDGETAGTVGLLAPGAAYSTIWNTTETVQNTWMQFSGTCQPLQVRLDELTRMTNQAGIPLDEALLKARYGGWTSTETAR